VLHWLHKDSVNTDCDCGDSQADPSCVSVALGELTGVKCKSCIFSDCRYSQGHPSCVSVALGEFTGVKLISGICSVVNT